MRSSSPGEAAAPSSSNAMPLSSSSDSGAEALRVRAAACHAACRAASESEEQHAARGLSQRCGPRGGPASRLRREEQAPAARPPLAARPASRARRPRRPGAGAATWTRASSSTSGPAAAPATPARVRRVESQQDLLLEHEAVGARWSVPRVCGAERGVGVAGRGAPGEARRAGWASARRRVPASG